VSAQGFVILIGQGVQEVVLPAAEVQAALIQVVVKKQKVVGFQLSLCQVDVGSVQSPFGFGLIVEWR
jgi:hypothetical protein